jgi:hypothetical protein
MGNLVMDLLDEKRYPEAEVLLRQTLEIKLRRLGPEHRSTLVTMGHLAETLSKEGQYAEAEQADTGYRTADAGAQPLRYCLARSSTSSRRARFARWF